MSSKSIVYVPQMPTRRVEGELVPSVNLAPAQKFGEIKIMLPNGATMFESAPLKARMETYLKDFCDDDYLLAVGDPTAMIWAGVLAAKHNRGNVKILKWDRHNRMYIVVS